MTFDRIIELVVGAVAAGATAWAAWSASKAAQRSAESVEATRQATTAQLISSLIEDWGSPRISDAYNTACEFLHDTLECPVPVPTDEVPIGWIVGEGNSVAQREFPVLLNFAERLHVLWRNKLLSDDHLRSIVPPTFIRVLSEGETQDRHYRRDKDHSMYADFRKVFNISLEVGDWRLSMEGEA